MDDLTNPTGIWGAAAGAVTAGIAGIFWVRKMLASTAAGVAGDRAEVNIIDTLQKERDALRIRVDQAEGRANDLFQQVASLTADLRIIKSQLDAITLTNQALNDKVGQLSTALEARR